VATATKRNVRRAAMSTRVMRGHAPWRPTLVIAAIEVAILAATALVVLRTIGVSLDGSVGRWPPAAIEEDQPTAPEADFVLEAPGAAQILRHRPGLTPVDIVRTHAFGWKGLTVRDVLRSPELVSVLRHRPGLSPLDLVEFMSG
jgi:hypothetical protein